MNDTEIILGFLALAIIGALMIMVSKKLQEAAEGEPTLLGYFSDADNYFFYTIFVAVILLILAITLKGLRAFLTGPLELLLLLFTLALLWFTAVLLMWGVFKLYLGLGRKKIDVERIQELWVLSLIESRCDTGITRERLRGWLPREPFKVAMKQNLDASNRKVKKILENLINQIEIENSSFPLSEVIKKVGDEISKNQTVWKGVNDLLQELEITDERMESIIKELKKEKIVETNDEYKCLIPKKKLEQLIKEEYVKKIERNIMEFQIKTEYKWIDKSKNVSNTESSNANMISILSTGEQAHEEEDHQ